MGISAGEINNALAAQRIDVKFVRLVDDLGAWFLKDYLLRCSFDILFMIAKPPEMPSTPSPQRSSRLLSRQGKRVKLTRRNLSYSELPEELNSRRNLNIICFPVAVPTLVILLISPRVKLGFEFPFVFDRLSDG